MDVAQTTRGNANLYKIVRAQIKTPGNAMVGTQGRQVLKQPAGRCIWPFVKSTTRMKQATVVTSVILVDMYLTSTYQCSGEDGMGSQLPGYNSDKRQREHKSANIG